MISVHQQFDGGNITLICQQSPTDIQLSIRHDSQSEFFQWFYFRVSGGRDTDLCLKIMNAGQAAFTEGWDGYQAMASYDQEHWFRVPTTYIDGQLHITHRPEYDAVYYAYFTPYPLTRHNELVAWAQTQPDLPIKRCR